MNYEVQPDSDVQMMKLEKVCIPCPESWKLLLALFYAMMKSYMQGIIKLSKLTLSAR
jgi:hypothetical protein